MTARIPRRVILISTDSHLAKSLERSRPADVQWECYATAAAVDWATFDADEDEFWVDLTFVRAPVPLPQHAQVAFFDNDTDYGVTCCPACLIHRSRIPHLAERLWRIRRASFLRAYTRNLVAVLAARFARN